MPGLPRSVVFGGIPPSAWPSRRVQADTRTPCGAPSAARACVSPGEPELGGAVDRGNNSDRRRYSGGYGSTSSDRSGVGTVMVTGTRRARPAASSPACHPADTPYRATFQRPDPRRLASPRREGCPGGQTAYRNGQLVHRRDVALGPTRINIGSHSVEQISRPLVGGLGRAIVFTCNMARSETI